MASGAVNIHSFIRYSELSVPVRPAIGSAGCTMGQVSDIDRQSKSGKRIYDICASKDVSDTVHEVKGTTQMYFDRMCCAHTASIC